MVIKSGGKINWKDVTFISPLFKLIKSRCGDFIKKIIELVAVENKIYDKENNNLLNFTGSNYCDKTDLETN